MADRVSQDSAYDSGECVKREGSSVLKTRPEQVKDGTTYTEPTEGGKLEITQIPTELERHSAEKDADSRDTGYMVNMKSELPSQVIKMENEAKAMDKTESSAGSLKDDSNGKNKGILRKSGSISGKRSTSRKGMICGVTVAIPNVSEEQKMTDVSTVQGVGGQENQPIESKTLSRDSQTDETSRCLAMPGGSLGIMNPAVNEQNWEPSEPKTHPSVTQSCKQDDPMKRLDKANENKSNILSRQIQLVWNEARLPLDNDSQGSSHDEQGFHSIPGHDILDTRVPKDLHKSIIRNSDLITEAERLRLQKEQSKQLEEDNIPILREESKRRKNVDSATIYENPSMDIGERLRDGSLMGSDSFLLSGYWKGSKDDSYMCMRDLNIIQTEKTSASESNKVGLGQENVHSSGPGRAPNKRFPFETENSSACAPIAFDQKFRPRANALTLPRLPRHRGKSIGDQEMLDGDCQRPRSWDGECPVYENFPDRYDDYRTLLRTVTSQEGGKASTSFDPHDVKEVAIQKCQLTKEAVSVRQLLQMGIGPKKPNLLFVGLQGVGKSSLINSLYTALNPTGYQEVSLRGSFGPFGDQGYAAITHDLRKYRLFKNKPKEADEQSYHCLPRLWDLPGLQDECNDKVSAILNLILQGCIPDGTSLSYLRGMDSPQIYHKYKKKKENRAMDMLVYVHAAPDPVPENLLAAIRGAAHKDFQGCRRIPIVVVITKKDLVDDSPSSTRELKDRIDEITRHLGMLEVEERTFVTSLYCTQVSPDMQRVRSVDQNMCQIWLCLLDPVYYPQRSKGIIDRLLSR